MKKKVWGIFLRYLILAILGIFLSIFYKIFLPLTIWPVYFLLSIFYNANVSGNMLFVSGASIELIDACVAGSAYYLLLILNLTTSMKLEKRLFSIAFSFLSLLILNILRIFILSVLFIQEFVFFDIAHKIFWYAMSVVFVVGIWFMTVKVFRVKKIPVYSDLKSLKH